MRENDVRPFVKKSRIAILLCVILALGNLWHVRSVNNETTQTEDADTDTQEKDYIKWVGNISEEDVALLEEVKVKNIYEYLKENNLMLKIRKAEKVTYHKPCNINNYEDIKWLLENTENLNYVQMNDFDKCCGLNGLSKIKEYRIMSKIFRAKKENIEKTGANVVLTSCLGCEVALKAYSFGRYKVSDLIEYIANRL